MMVSAVTIDGLDKMEQKEHFFNDVKYATVSLNKDIKQISEQFEHGIFKLDVGAIKKRLQDEYSEFMKPTYGFLQLEGFSFEHNDLMQYLINTEEVFKQSISGLSQIVAITATLSEYGLRKHWNYQNLKELTLIFDSVRKDVIPTRYWFDRKKYDFMQELMNETQTKVEEYLTASKRLHQSWSEEVLQSENVAALDYYMDRREAGLKLFDLNFHKCKKLLKDLFTDEYRTFQDSEIEQLHKNVYIIKKNEYWLSKNLTRIRQFLGDSYQETETDFTLLRTQYAIMYKLGTEYSEEDCCKQLAAAMIEAESYQNLTGQITELKGCLQTLPYEKLMEALPCVKEEAIQQDVLLTMQIVKGFHETITHLNQDYTMFQSYRHMTCAQDEFQLEDMRKVLYCLERIGQKRDWLKKHQAKIKELFRNEEPTLDTDWNAMKDKLFRTDVKESFPMYETVDKITFQAANGGQLKLLDVLRYVLYMESPIKDELLYKRIVNIMELARMTPKMKLEIKQLLASELKEEYVVDNSFIYAVREEKLELRIPANEEEKREIGLIAPMELKAGIVTLLEVNYEMTLDAIGKEIAGLLGYPRRTKKFNDIVEQAVKELQRENKIRRYSGGFRNETYCN